MREDFADHYGPWALVAGASEGIGAAFARHLAAARLNLVLLARRKDPLKALAAGLAEEHHVEMRWVDVDLTSPDLWKQLVPATAGIDVGLVVFNAGAVHGAELFVERPLEDALGLVALNCQAVVSLAHHFARSMVERQRGGLVFMTSLSAAAGSGYTAVYNATKAFDLVLAEGLWMELAGSGVDVLAVPAGLTDTPAMRRSGIIGTAAGFEAMEANQVAAEALDVLGVSGPLLVPGPANREAAGFLWPAGRAPLIRSMTDGATALYDKDPLADPPTAPRTSPEAAVEVLGFDHLVLRVEDPEAMLAWYGGRLGLEPLRVEEWRRGEVPFPSVRVDGGTIIDLLPGTRSGENLDHLCLVVRPQDVAAVLADPAFCVVDGPSPRFGARGIGTSVYVTDPESNVVELRHYG